MTDPSLEPILVLAGPTRVGWVKPSRDSDRRASILTLEGLGKYINFILPSAIALHAGFWMYYATMQRWTLMLGCLGRGRNPEDDPLMKTFGPKCGDIVLRNDRTP